MLQRSYSFPWYWSCAWIAFADHTHNAQWWARERKQRRVALRTTKARGFEKSELLFICFESPQNNTKPHTILSWPHTFFVRTLKYALLTILNALLHNVTQSRHNVFMNVPDTSEVLIVNGRWPLLNLTFELDEKFLFTFTTKKYSDVIFSSPFAFFVCVCSKTAWDPALVFLWGTSIKLVSSSDCLQARQVIMKKFWQSCWISRRKINWCGVNVCCVDGAGAKLCLCTRN